MSDEQSDEDWFERALREDEEADATGADDRADEDPDSWTTDDESDDETADASAGDRGPDEEPDDGGAADGLGGADDDDAGSGGAFGEDPGGPFGENGGGDTNPFGDEGGTASESPFGDDDGSPFGDDGGEGLFDEDFGSAFDSGGDEEFDDEEFESSIPRIDLGIEGLDDMIQGGIPRHHLIVVIGSAGTGKTTFGLQFLYHGLQNGENTVFITLEQSHESIIDTANEWGWDFDEYEADDSLAVVDLDPVEMANSLDNIRVELPELIEDFDADRLVLDSVSLLEMMYNDPAKRRTEVFDFTRSLKAAGVTTFLTSEASESNPYASRHGIIEYLTDAVFILQYVRSESQEARLAVEIQKIRNANHSREMKPYDITMEGISVYQQANIF